MRDIYSTVGISLGRIEYFGITTAMAPGRDRIDDDSEAEDLTNEYTVQNAGCDVFFVREYVGWTSGRSAIDGPFDKDAGIFDGFTGSVVEVDTTLVHTTSPIFMGDVNYTGITLAHEVGHYLGLNHHYITRYVAKGVSTVTLDRSRVMCPEIDVNSQNMVPSEGKDMAKHGFALHCS